MPRRFMIDFNSSKLRVSFRYSIILYPCLLSFRSCKPSLDFLHLGLWYIFIINLVSILTRNYNCDVVSFCPCDIRYAFRNEFMLPSITASTFPVSWAVLTSFTNLYGCIT